MKILKISEINESIRKNSDEFIAKSMQSYHNSLSEAADKIVENFPKKSVVLISGPSGSGKTTSAHRLEDLLAEKGLTAHTISMDNYFLPLNENSESQPRNPDGTIDLESPYRLNLPLLNAHLQCLKNGVEIAVPEFDFLSNSVVGYTPLKRNKNDVFILEGIHALNPLVTGECHDFATCIYVSVRTRVENINGDRLHPRLIRLMRRLSRDSLFRGRPIEGTFEMFKSVSRGEDVNILQFKHLADFDIDTFIPFEIPSYKAKIFDKLVEVKENMYGYYDYDIILEFLKEVVAIDTKNIPEEALIREFIGEK